MAAIRVGDVEKNKPRNGYDTYSYEQTIPIPSYLISFIVGVFESQDISDRIRVWAEPSMLAKAAYEFANVSSPIPDCSIELFTEFFIGILQRSQIHS
ncbi:unnamed protein product [Anisakis simplex]|uniref:DDE_Tnp_1_7 domain-containing protein n=1 Tax=Anisakis simplex TaxID=6269 RepID=A0A0M3JPK8_ANISI|nr:unnamed protein product [Anisakis simplex]